MDCDAGSGKISSSPFSNPSKMPTAADSVEAFGISLYSEHSALLSISAFLPRRR
jgi:hypothetical protein